MRRVQLDDDGPAAYSEGVEPWGEDDCYIDPDWLARIEREEADEARQERLEIERALAGQDDDGGQPDDEPRAMDLARRDPITGPTRPAVKLTEAQVRAREAWAGVARGDEPSRYTWTGDDAMELWREDAEHQDPSALRVRRRPQEHDSRDDRTSDDIPLPRDDGPSWLDANDPTRRADGVRDEIDRALEAVGVTRDMLPEVFKGGRPSASRQHVRGLVREALLPMFEDDRRRDFMADALGCSTNTLRSLLRQPS